MIKSSSYYLFTFKKHSHTLILTLNGGREAESIVAVEEAMSLPVAAQTRSQVHAATSFTWDSDWILHGAVSQPAGVAPVETLLPRREELLKRSKSGVLILARLLGPEEVKMVASLLRVVGKNHPCTGKTSA